MAKANNPRLQVQMTPELKEITDKMLEHLEMTQAEFFEKYLPTLFLAIDKEKYLSLVEEVYSNEELRELIKKRLANIMLVFLFSNIILFRANLRAIRANFSKKYLNIQKYKRIKWLFYRDAA